MVYVLPSTHLALVPQVIVQLGPQTKTILGPPGLFYKISKIKRSSKLPTAQSDVFKLWCWCT